MARLSVRETVLQPGFLLGCLGIAICLAVRDLQQFITFDITRAEAASRYAFSIGRALSSLALLVIVWIVMRGNQRWQSGYTSDSNAAGSGMRVRRHLSSPVAHIATPVCIAGAVLETVGLALLFASSTLYTHIIGAVMLGLGQSTLIIGCILYVLWLHERTAYLALAASFIAAGTVEMLLALMNPRFVTGIVIVLPAASCVMATIGFGHIHPDAFRMHVAGDDRGDADGESSPSSRWPRSLVLPLLTFFGYSIIARELTDAWMGGLAEESLEMFQLFGGLGTALAGVVVYLVFRLSRRLKESSAHTVLIVFAVAVTLYLSTFLTGYASVFFVVPLFILRKMLLFLPVMLARDQGSPQRDTCTFIVGMLAVDTGNIVQTALFEAVRESSLPTETISSIIMLVILVFIVAVDTSNAAKALGKAMEPTSPVSRIADGIRGTDTQESQGQNPSVDALPVQPATPLKVVPSDLTRPDAETSVRDTQGFSASLPTSTGTVTTASTATAEGAVAAAGVVPTVNSAAVFSGVRKTGDATVAASMQTAVSGAQTTGNATLTDSAQIIDSVVAALATEFGLSPRETEVLACLAAGRNADYIARTLVIAPSTAKSHIAHIYRKCSLNSQQRLMDEVERRRQV